jgi:hypothetical protein
VGELRLNADKNIVLLRTIKPIIWPVLLGWLCFSTCKREFSKRDRAIEEKAITLIPEETRTTFLLKIRCYFCIRMDLQEVLVIQCIKTNRLRNVAGWNCCSKQVQNKIQGHFLYRKPVPAVTLSVKSTTEAKCSYGWVYREEKNADKTLQFARLGYDAKRIAPNKTVIIPFYMVVMPHLLKLKRKKNNIKHNQKHVWILNHYNKKRYILSPKGETVWDFWSYLHLFAICFGLVKKEIWKSMMLLFHFTTSY